MNGKYVQYLYAYEGDQPVRNIGFIKVNQTSGRGIIHLYARGLQLGKDRPKLYITFQRDDVCYGVLTGEIERTEPEIQYRLEFTGEDLPAHIAVGDISGLVIVASDGQKFATFWGPETCRISQMRLAEPKRNEKRAISEEPALEELGADGPALEEPTLQEPVVEEPTSQEPELGEPELDGPELEEPTSQEPESGEPVMEEPALQEPVLEESMPSGSDMPPLQTHNIEDMAVTQPEDDYISADGYHYEKIDREDLSRLNRKEWPLANNSFLLHGYYNYHFLLHIEREGVHWLGVPGIYHEQEEILAKKFGFPQFHVPEEDDPDTREYDMENFGYWCRQIGGFSL